MSAAALKFINDRLTSVNINYEFVEWTTDPIPGVYFVGEYSEVEPENEDGMQETNFILTGTSRTTWSALEQCRQSIEQLFSKISGETAILPNGSGIAVFYSNSLIVPTGNDELKRIQINLTIKEWSVN